MRLGISAAVLTCAAVLFFGGCAKAFKPQNYEALTPGMSKAQVQEKMGKPMGTATKSGVETWIYDRHDPISSRQERIELRFENGVYKEMSKSSPPSD